jgi:uncharacterized membrane protein (UPF0127 family)
MIVKPKMAALALAASMVAAVASGCTQSPATQPVAQSPSGLDVVPLKIRSGGKVHDFTVEVARTVEEQARGLMFRESLAPNAGMVFPFPQPRPASFWMKNTLIPLDMIFVRADGTIARIAVNTVPHSLDPVAVEEPVAAVLELAGGRTVELGISEGDRVGWPGGPTL